MNELGNFDEYEIASVVYLLISIPSTAQVRYLQDRFNPECQLHRVVPTERERTDMIHRSGTPLNFRADLSSHPSSMPQIGLLWLETSSSKIWQINSTVLEKPVAKITRSYLCSHSPLRTT